MTSFKFTPKSEEELSSLLAEGDAGFEILDSLFKISQNSGRPMLKLTLKVWDSNGEEGKLDDFIILDELSKFSMRKYKHLCESTNLEKVYECGEIGEVEASLFKEKSGKLRLGINKNNKNKDGSPLPPKNCVWDYLKQPEPKKTEVIADDDMPAF